MYFADKTLFYLDNNFWLKKDKEYFSLYMNPALFFKKNSKDALEIPPCAMQRALFELQNIMHTFLESFLNGYSLPRYSKVFFPFMDYYASYFTRLDEILFLVNMLQDRDGLNLSRFSNKIRNIAKKRARFLHPWELAECISFFYRESEDESVSRTVGKQAKIITIKKKFREAEYLENDREYLAPLVFLSRYARDHFEKDVLGFYLHGSLSTMDYIKGCSDVDTLIIVAKHVIESPEKLLQLRRKVIKARRYFYSIDPLQHHGFYVIAEQDMLCYPQTYFPLILFDFSTEFFQKPDKLLFYERDSSLECKNALWDICYYFRKRFLLGDIPSDAFEMKLFLQILLLLPTIYLQTDGSFCYKKFSFEKARREFDKTLWNIVDRATEVRNANLWGYSGAMPPAVKSFLTRLPNPFWFEIALKKLDNSIPTSVKRKMGGEFLYEAFRLSDAMLELARMQGKI